MLLDIIKLSFSDEELKKLQEMDPQQNFGPVAKLAGRYQMLRHSMSTAMKSQES